MESIGIGLVITVVLTFLFFQHPQFGQLPKGDNLEKLKQSPNYRKGKFWNQIATPALAENTNYWKVMGKLLFQSGTRKRPSVALPTIKTDLKGLRPDENVMVWFGHSSYFIQTEGVKILVDPVFSGSASPLPFGTRSFQGTDIYSVADMPEIDYLLITHDHWDHLDYSTVRKLKPKIKKIICGLGTGAHFRAWGYQNNQVDELDWYDSRVLKKGISLHALPARHFSGRSLRRNPTLWLAFSLSTPKRKLYLGGDSGYGPHFKAAGDRFGPFDLAVLENGQYNPDWRYIHLLPEQFFPAARDLRTHKVLSVHNSKFSLARHSWDAPLKAVSGFRQDHHPQLLSPRIGEKMNLDSATKTPAWWEGIE